MTCFMTRPRPPQIPPDRPPDDVASAATHVMAADRWPVFQSLGPDVITTAVNIGVGGHRLR